MHLGALPPAFAGLAQDDAQEAASFLESFGMEAGEKLMEQGEEDYTLAFLVSGAVSFLDDGVRIGGGGARDMVGEVELFAQIPRTTTVEATAPTNLLVLAYEAWLELCERGNPAVFNIERASHRRIGDRLRQLSEGIAERTSGGPLPDAPRQGGLMGRLSGMFGGRPAALDATSVLAQSPLFSWAEPAILAEIGRMFQSERFPARTEVCRQGELGEKAFVLVEGEVDVVVATGPNTAEPIASLGAGSVFGDAAVAQHAPRPASCFARTDISVLTIGRGQFGALFAGDDAAGSVFRQALVKNLVGQLLAAQTRYVQLERSSSERVEQRLRGTPASSVWRD
jgi:CRP-like cAMP-binding protein